MKAKFIPGVRSLLWLPFKFKHVVQINSLGRTSLGFTGQPSYGWEGPISSAPRDTEANQMLATGTARGEVEEELTMCQLALNPSGLECHTMFSGLDNQENTQCFTSSCLAPPTTAKVSLGGKEVIQTLLVD